ncbi:MAG: hypothetical protein NC252_03435 [Roseburia sp.]|nr:hypothetical protein [Roseburia sp.]MCM1421012.1 hypothetical protein [Bacteroides sp.]
MHDKQLYKLCFQPFGISQPPTDGAETWNTCGECAGAICTAYSQKGGGRLAQTVRITI